MARTSRNAPSANVQALDNLDLDDMFADGGDDLFDGLDIDLGNMEDITGNNVQPTQEIEAQLASAASPSSAAVPSALSEAPKRRKTKRKTTAPTFFDDQDDEYVEEQVKKKKRTSKGAPATTTKKRGSKKATTAAAASQEDVKTAPTAPVVPSKKTKAKTTMPPPSAKVSTTAGFAGGPRRKSASGTRQTSNKLVDKASVAKATSTSASAATASKTSKSQAVVQLPPHPGLKQGPFCGLMPSNTLFYPFLPALPQEVALKNRKIYSLMDRLHSTFTSQMSSSNRQTNGTGPIKPTETIIQLLQEAFKEEKSSSSETPEQAKAEIIGAAVSNSRRTIDIFDKTKLAQDLLAVCALLQRQHNFLKQNATNMEKWCREHMQEDEYKDVYLPPKAKRKSLMKEEEQLITGTRKPNLATLVGSTFRVKVTCTGLKGPKTALQATIPGPNFGLDLKKATTAKSPKKKKSATEEVKAPPVPVVAAQPTYAQLRPAKRRKAVADLISRTAFTLETDFYRGREQRRQTIAARDKRAREAAEDQSYQVAHTGGMWKWLEEMGYCDDQIDDMALRERLENARSLNWGELQHMGKAIQSANSVTEAVDLVLQTNTKAPTSYAENLMDLLVDEGDCSSDDDDDDDDDDEEDHGENGNAENGIEEKTEREEFFEVGSCIADMSSLIEEEKVFLHLRSVGLSQADWSQPTGSNSSVAKSAEPTQHVSTESVNGTKQRSDIPEDNNNKAVDIESVIELMKQDLVATSELNNRRAVYLETAAQATLETPKERKQRKLFEGGLHARHASIVKRNKEMKAKNGKLKNSKHDDLALPW